MKPKSLLHLCCAGLALASCSPLWAATDLVQSYELAKENDADLLTARAAADAAIEAKPLALSQMLPSVTASASFFDNRLDTITKINSRYDEYPSQSIALTLRQPIFRPALIYSYRQAQAQVPVLGEAAEDGLGLEELLQQGKREGPHQRAAQVAQAAQDDHHQHGATAVVLEMQGA